jgi:hypothetical protein
VRFRRNHEPAARRHFGVRHVFLFYGFAHSGIDNAAHLGGLAAGFIMD